jgi:GLPGLI family protein
MKYYKLLALYICIASQTEIHAQPLNFIEYKIEHHSGKIFEPLKFVYKNWFNDSIIYYQIWDEHVGFLNYDRSPFTHADSITYRDMLQDHKRKYIEENRDTYYTNTKIDSIMYIVDYGLLKDRAPYYYKSKNYKNFLSDIILIDDTAKIILGQKCKLAIATFNYTNGPTAPASFWYSNDIKAPFGPSLYIKNAPGLIMELVVEGRDRYTAVNLEMPAKWIGNFNLNITTIKFHTEYEYWQECEKYRQRMELRQKEIEKQNANK